MVKQVAFDFTAVLNDTKKNMADTNENMRKAIDENTAKMAFIEDEIKFFTDNHLVVMQEVEVEDEPTEEVAEVPVEDVVEENAN